MKFTLLCVLVATALASPIRQVKLEDLEADLLAVNVTPSAKEVAEYAKLVKAREEEVREAIDKIETSSERRDNAKALDKAVKKALDQQVANFKADPDAFNARVHNDSSKLNIVVKPNREMLELDSPTGTAAPDSVIPAGTEVPSGDNNSLEEGSGRGDEGNSSGLQPGQNDEESSEYDPVIDEEEPEESTTEYYYDGGYNDREEDDEYYTDSNENDDDADPGYAEVEYDENGDPIIDY